MRRRWLSSGIAVRHELPRFLPIQRRSAGGQTSNTIAHFALDLSAKRAGGGFTDPDPDRLAPVAPPAPMGLRGVWVVASRCCAGTIERSVVCPSANLRGPVRRGLHPSYVQRRP